jgi:hypothetical protein
VGLTVPDDLYDGVFARLFTALVKLVSDYLFLEIVLSSRRQTDQHSNTPAETCSYILVQQQQIAPFIAACRSALFKQRLKHYAATAE